MMTTEEIRKLAELARLTIPDEELPSLAGEFEAILEYVGQLEKLGVSSGSAAETSTALCNVMREDGAPHAAGVYTEKLVEQFPLHDGNALSVKQIISHD